MFNFNEPLSVPVVFASDEDSLASQEPNNSSWPKNMAEGQLAIDVLQTEREIIVMAPLAGTTPEKIEIHLHNDFLTIRGTRAMPNVESYEPVYQECFWGPFSRTVVLPVEVDNHLAKAEYRFGLLTIRIPKRERLAGVPILVVEE